MQKVLPFEIMSATHNSIRTSYYFAQLITEALVHRVLEKSKLSNSWRQLFQLLGLCGSWLHTVLEHGRPLT